MVRAAVAGFVAAALLWPAVARAQDSRWEEQVQNQLRAASQTLADKGYERTHEIKTGTLRDDESESYTMELDGDRQYAIIGVCDNDCDDLDLVLYNMDDDEIDADRKTDDVPIVTVAPSRTRKYRLKIIMSSCKTSPCWYGVGVYAK